MTVSTGTYIGNNALEKNGFTNTVTTNNHITYAGSDVYFAVTAIMMFSTLVFMGLSYTKPRSERLFHYITAAITLVASIAYFSMGSNLGWTAILVEFPRPTHPKVGGLERQIFYVRYIDWFVTTPLLLLDLLLTCGMPTPTIVYTILMNEIMVVTGLVGALVKSNYKWGYYVFGNLAFFFVAYTVVFEGRAHARVLGNDILKTYTLCGVWTIALWFLYPIAWGVSEGGNVIPSDSEAVFYGILDVLAKPGFGALLLYGHRNIQLSRLGLSIREPTEARGVENNNNNNNEKRSNNNSNNNNNNTNGYHNTNSTTNGDANGYTASTEGGMAPARYEDGNTPVHNAATV